VEYTDLRGLTTRRLLRDTSSYHVVNPRRPQPAGRNRRLPADFLKRT
jgi:hypothetical protein